jgi:hypothetical protein
LKPNPLIDVMIAQASSENCRIICRRLWARSPLDLTAHERLLQVLGKFYGDTYLTQEGRLKGMECLDFVLSEVHGLRIKEILAAKAQGRKEDGVNFLLHLFVQGAVDDQFPDGLFPAAERRIHARGADSPPGRGGGPPGELYPRPSSCLLKCGVARRRS